MIGLMPLVVAEAAFVLFDVGKPGLGEDPFVGFDRVRPLFVPSGDGTRYEIPPSRQTFFRPESFAAEKKPGEVRIFCLGGSTVQGRPWAVETSLTTWLEISLNEAEPTRHWNVINCGGVSYASYRLVPILEEVLDYEPDLIILYTGHNEFLEDRTYAHLKYLPDIVAKPAGMLARTRTYTLLQRGIGRLRGESPDMPHKDRPILREETDAMLEYEGGLAKYHRDVKWRRDVIEHFRFNLRRMVRMAHDRGVPVLLVNPVCNLRDCAPFKSQHGDGLLPEERTRWNSLAARASRPQLVDTHERLNLLKQAAVIDDHHAGLHFRMAKCYDKLGEMEKARQSYVRAKELDVCPLRIVEPMHRAILDAARETDTPLLDVREQFERLTDDRIPGGYFMVDHVHPSIAGYQLIGKALTDKLIEVGTVRPSGDWEARRDAKFETHYLSLDDLYFAKGEQRIKSLRRWTRGEVAASHPRYDPPRRSSR